MAKLKSPDEPVRLRRNTLRVSGAKKMQPNEESNNFYGLYCELRSLIQDAFKISIVDGKKPTVSITPDGYEQFPWTSFSGATIEDAFKRAVSKFRNPETDYRAIPSFIDTEGHLWPASGSSCYSEVHIRQFLKDSR